MPHDKLWTKDLAAEVAGRVIEDAPMSRYTTMGVGGPADALFTPRDAADLLRGLRFLRERGVGFHVVGLGTNLLVRDAGVRGAVVRVAYGGRDKLTGVGKLGVKVWVWAGAPLGAVVRETARRGLAGLEKLAGIPGTVGGAVWMNAGAFGVEIGQYVSGVHTVNREGKDMTYRAEDCSFDYRHSIFHHKPGEIIANVELTLEEGDAAELEARMRDTLAARAAKQPQRVRTSGSTFKNPPGGSAARLIDAAGLKGLRVGGAEVSRKHANFIINTGGATCDDVLRLMESVVKKVEAASGLTLEPEIRVMR